MGDDVLRGDLAVADGREQTVRVRVVELVGHADQRLGRHQRGDRQVALAHGAGQVVAAFLDGLAAAFLAEPLPDLVAGLRALDEAQPVAGRTGGIGLGGEHLHGVAVLQFGVQRHQTAVDARAHRTMAHLGVHGVGEVDRRGLRGQGHDLALRREHVDLGRAEILLQRTQELVRVGGLARPIGKLLDPLEVVGLAELLVLAVLALAVVGVRRAQRTPGLPVGLVLPMRGDAELGAPVHVPCADLDLHRLAARAHHRGVQALVHVELGHGDVVLEPARHRAPPRVHGAERRIAVADRIDDDAHAHQVVDVLEIVPAHDHLLVDREVVLRTARDVGLDVLFFEILVDLAQDLLEVHVALAGPAGHQHHNLVVDLRVEHLEAQFLELRLDGVHAQPVGQRGVHVQRLAGLLLRAGGFHVPPGAGVVHAVGELDDQHAHVTAHRHHHLADGLGLRRIAVFHLGELGHAVHQTGDGVAEFGAALLQRVVGVLHRVVQQAGRHHQGPHAQVRQDLRHRQRMDDVRLAGLAALGGMLAHRPAVGAVEDVHILVRVVRLAGVHNRFERIERIAADLATERTSGEIPIINVGHHRCTSSRMHSILPLRAADGCVECRDSGGYARRPESPFGAVRSGQRFRRDEPGLHIPLNHQLGDAVAGVERHGMLRIQID